MNVFVLNSGRCGSMTFAQACRHIENYTSAHESLVKKLGNARIEYPDQHIESDCRLVYFLGRLNKKYGTRAFYVHLRRNKDDSIASWKNRLNNKCIIHAHAVSILLHYEFAGYYNKAEEFIVDYINNIDENIQMFLKDKPLQMNFDLENAKKHFEKFWLAIGAYGNYKRAIAEWDVKYNSSKKQ